ncbi:MAG: hypothetical protein ACT4TC_14740 [Myxococcaceae bacterium]
MRNPLVDLSVKPGFVEGLGSTVRDPIMVPASEEFHSSATPGDSLQVEVLTSLTSVKGMSAANLRGNGMTYYIAPENEDYMTQAFLMELAELVVGPTVANVSLEIRFDAPGPADAQDADFRRPPLWRTRCWFVFAGDTKALQAHLLGFPTYPSDLANLRLCDFSVHSTSSIQGTEPR